MLTKIKAEKYIHLSQNHLTIFENCPRQFQDIYLDNFSLISEPEKEEKQLWGKHFHLLMQQRELGLNLDNVLSENQEIAQYFERLLTVEPDLFVKKKDELRDAEHCRTLAINDYLFTVIYDLLITNTNEAKIIDWKTYPQPTQKNKLIKNWQTRLYLYVLSETSNYLPEQISFTYWFVKLPKQPEKVTLNYDTKQHKKTAQDIHKLLTRLDENLEKYVNSQENFTHPTGNKNCKYCQSLHQNQDFTQKIYQLLG